MELINQLPKGHPGLERLIKKNYKIIDTDKLKYVNPNLNEQQIEQLYKTILEEILISNPNAFELLKNLLVLNMEIGTNIDRGSIETCCKFKDTVNSIKLLFDTGIIKKKKGKEDIYEFTYQQIQDYLKVLTDKENHKNAIKYYKKKLRRHKDDIQDLIELLYHKTIINPSEELVNEFLTIANNIIEFNFKHKRLLDVAQELFILEDKYKAPILTVVGNLLSALGNSEDAEKIYLNALEIYKNLAKKYYRIYLPYIVAAQKNLGTLYIDLKRFEEAEKIYTDALSSYRDLEKQYYEIYSPDHDAGDHLSLEESYIDQLKAYNKILKNYYDIYLPEETSISIDSKNIYIDLDLLEDIKDGSIDSIESYKTLAKMSYDMYLIDIAKTQSNLGIVYSELGKFEDAEQMHLEALKIKRKIAEHYPNQVLPELVLTLLDLGDLYASLNKFEDAEPMFNEALKISKQLAQENPDVYMHNVAIIQNSLGTVYTRLKKFEKAEQMYIDALKIFKNLVKENPKAYSYNVADVQNNLGSLFLILRNLEKAELYLNKAIKKDSANIDIIYNLACLESLRNNPTKALELLAIVIKVDKNYIQRVLSDDRFDNIRELKEFKELTSN